MFKKAYGRVCAKAVWEQRRPKPSLDDGPSICLGGQAKIKDTEHELAHRGTDPRIATAGGRTDNGGKGLAPIGEIIEIAVEEVSKIKPHCADEIKKKTDDAFKGVDRNKYGRTTPQPPKKGSEARGTMERGENHQRSDRGRKRRP